MSKPLILKHDEMLKNELIRVGISNNITLDASQNRVAFQMKYDTEQYRLGEGLTLESDGTIKIGPGINVILVTCQIYWHRPSKINEAKLVEIQHTRGNNNQVAGAMTSRQGYNVTQTTLQAVTTMPVQEGDYIKILATGSEDDVISNYAMYTYLDVVKLS